jgi:hypothetical protein
MGMDFQYHLASLEGRKGGGNLLFQAKRQRDTPSSSVKLSQARLGWARSPVLYSASHKSQRGLKLLLKRDQKIYHPPIWFCAFFLFSNGKGSDNRTNRTHPTVPACPRSRSFGCHYCPSIGSFCAMRRYSLYDQSSWRSVAYKGH